MPPAYGLNSPTLSVASGQSSQPPALVSQPPANTSSGPKMLTFKDIDDLTSSPLVFIYYLYTRRCIVAACVIHIRTFRFSITFWRMLQ